MIKAILFDAYGTLISTGTGSLDAAEKILALNHRTDISPSEFYAEWKRLHKRNIETTISFVKEETIFKMDLNELYVRYHMSRNPNEDVQIMLETLGKRRLFPETEEVIEKLKHDFTVAIASTTDTDPLLQDLLRNQLTIPYIFTSESLQVYKPHASFYQAILSKLQITAEEAIFVGDSLIDDIWGPQQLGMLTCWLNRKNNPRQEIVPSFEISNLNELLKIVYPVK